MNIIEAMNYLNAGKKIRRQGWANKEYWIWDTSGITPTYFHRLDFYDDVEDEDPGESLLEDILSSDWIAENP